MNARFGLIKNLNEQSFLINKRSFLLKYCSDYGNKKCTCPSPVSSDEESEEEAEGMPTKKEMMEAAALAAAILSPQAPAPAAPPAVV